MPENTISVTRPGKFGNPFTAKEAMEAGYKDGNKMAVWAFSEWLSGKENDFSELLPDKKKLVLKHIKELKGMNLACWCALDQPCHADVLLDLANGINNSSIISP